MIELKEIIKSKLLANITINTTTNCWEWIGTKDSDNYGGIRINNIRYQTHRASLYVFKDFDLNLPLMVRHSCDNPPCINPDHLLSGVSKDNIQDCIQRGRRPKMPDIRERKEYCKNGHKLDLVNRMILNTGGTRCRQCVNDRGKINYNRSKNSNG